MATLEALLVAPAVNALRDRIIARLQGRGLQTTDWLDGGPERTFIEAYAAELGDVYLSQRNIARGGFIDLAVAAGLTDWLDFIGHEFYQLDRLEAVATEGLMTLACAGTAGPYTITAGQLWAVGAGGNRYNNTTGGVLSSGGTRELAWRAERPGAFYNDGNDTIVALATPLPGVTINNPGPAFSAVTHTGSGSGTWFPSGTVAAKNWVILITLSGNLGSAKFTLSQDGGATFGGEHTVPGILPSIINVDGSGLTLSPTGGNTFDLNDTYTFSSPGSWITQPGKDAEANADYGARMKARWPSLAAIPTEDKYVLWAFAAAPQSITRATANASPTTTATITITVAGPLGTVSNDVLNAIKAYIQGPRAGLTVVVQVVSATAVPLDCSGTIYVEAAKRTAAQAAVQLAIQRLVAVVPIGGYDLGGGTTVLPWSMVAKVIENVDGIISIGDDFSIDGNAVEDQALAATEVVTYVQSASSAFTWVDV